MKSRISGRLSAIIDMAGKANCVADIGCDHALVPIELIRNRQSKQAIAMDVAEGPLFNAMQNISKAGLTDVIETRLSDGLENLSPKEADCIIISGMGGILIRDILARKMDTWQSASTLIFSPHRDIDRLRLFMADKGECIEERVVKEDNKYYTIIKYVPVGTTDIDYGYLFFGNPILQSDIQTYREYLIYEKERLLSIKKRIEESSITSKSDIIEKKLSAIEVLLNF